MFFQFFLSWEGVSDYRRILTPTTQGAEKRKKEKTKKNGGISGCRKVPSKKKNFRGMHNKIINLRGRFTSLARVAFRRRAFRLNWE